MSSEIDRLGAALDGRYRIERELGQGGMATVYLAHDLRHDRDVAIKVLHPDLGAALGSERFLSEIRTTARLQHPHILPLLDSGEAAGQLYYVMPMVSGETLRARLEREKQLPIPDAVVIAREVASALDYAHRQGVIHRDIKPENVLLHDGSALVADFGIALAVQSAGGQRMTQTGLSLGTPQYMSPEQAMGERTIDARSDIYALGAMTYEMLTGEPPFTGATVQAVVAKVLSAEPERPTLMRKTIPPGIEAAVLTALAKLPADRFATAAEFSTALAQGPGAAMTAPGAPVTARQGGRGSVARGAVLAGVVGLLAAGAGWWVGRRNAPLAESPELRVRMLTGQRGGTLLPLLIGSLSPDGRQFGYSATDSAGAPGVWLADLATGRTRRLRNQPVVMAGMSPNGKLAALYNLSDVALEIMPMDGGTPRVIGHATGVAAWVDDSTLVQAFDASVVRLRLRSGDAPALDTVLSAAAGTARVRGISPLDANRVMLMRATASAGDADIEVLDLRERRSRPIGLRGGNARYVGGGVLLFVRDGNVLAQRVDSATLALRGSPEVIVPDEVDGRVQAFTASQSGLLIVRRAAGAEARELVLVDRRGKAEPLLPERREYLEPRFSPDGRRVAFAEAGRATNGGDVFVATVATRQRVRVSQDLFNRAVEWTADGRSLLMARNDSGGGVRVLRVPVDGGADTATLLRRPRNVYELQAPRDLSRLLWREDVPGSARDILMAEARVGAPVLPLRTTKNDERGIALSPDGAWYAYVSSETGEDQVYLSQLGDNGPRWPVSRAGGIEPRWARNGELFFRWRDTVFVTRPQLAAVPSVPPPQPLFGGAYVYAGFQATWDVSPDGQRFAMVKGAASQPLAFELVANWRERFLRTHP